MVNARTRTRQLSLAWLLVAAGFALPACSADEEDQSSSGAADEPVAQACLSNRDYLARVAWPEVLGATCITCHGPGGDADQRESKFILAPPASPGFLDTNLENITNVGAPQVEGKSVLLLTPTGELEHGGGMVLDPEGEQYKVLSTLMEYIQGGEEAEEERLSRNGCTAEEEKTAFDDVQLLSAEDTFRKAALQLNGRLPTAKEYEQLEDEGDEALPGMIAGLMEENAFYERLVEVFNDQWLTDRYLRDGQNVLRAQDFPKLDSYYGGLSDEDRVKARRSVAREPLQLMTYIVRNNLPFTEIVTADYTALNPFTATIYNNNQLSFDGQYDDQEFQVGKIYVERQERDEEGNVVQRTLEEWPHAGILSSPIFLNRYPTSRTNRNRHRARIVLRELLATDILKIADRPIDPTASVSLPNPTREDPACKTCHAILDPIAGAFQKFDDNDQERYLPNREWHEEMLPPGFGTEAMKGAENKDALAWLGQRIAKDPRFATAVVNNVYKSLTGEQPLDFPADPSGSAYLSWQAQESTLRGIASSFRKNEFNFKHVVSGIVLSPYYRAKNTAADDDRRLAQLDAMGTGQLLTPELLNRKLTAVFGYTWRSRNQPTLTSDLNILYGGIDSETVTERLTRPNGIMSAIMWRLSTEMSCRSVPADFGLPQDSRLLFPYVEVDTVPENDIGDENQEATEAIRKNIRYLYRRLLGEELKDDSAESIRAFELFRDTWAEGRSKRADDRVSENLPGDCQYRVDPFTGEEVPEGQRIGQDANYVIRSWMAVTTYLLSDYRFLYE